MGIFRNVVTGAKHERPRAQTETAAAPVKAVLLIGDDPAVLSGLKRAIFTMRRSWTVVTANSGEEGVEVMKSREFDAVISDMSMPDMHGIEVLTHVQDNYPNTLRVALTGWVDEEWKIKKQTIAQVFLSKPAGVEDVVGAVEFPEKFRLAPTGNAPAPITSTAQSTYQRPLEPARRIDWNDENEVEFS